MMACSLGTLLSTSLLLLLLAATSGTVVLCGLSPAWRSWLGPWHAPADLAALLLAYGILSGLAVRLLLACLPLRAGTYRPGDAAYARWQRVVVVAMLGQWILRPFAPPILRPLVARLYGARLGAGVIIGGAIDDPWMVAVGAGAVIGHEALVSGNTQTGGRLILGQVEIGPGAVIGAHAVVMPGCTLGANAQLGIGAVLVPGTTVGAGESWRGNPARPWKPAAPAAPAAVEAA